MTVQLHEGRARRRPDAPAPGDVQRRRAGGVAGWAASFLERRVDRRGVLRRGAMAGTALAVAPTTYVLRPTSAYAAVCSPGALCNDGYTEFCCTLSGANRCPPGTALGGWWKVDGSNFCGGGPRYYMDCNAACGGCGCGSNGICPGSCSGTGCGCALGDCNNRKAGCTAFRYGQCNQAVRCLGPIVCRVVTCTEPWRIDGSCTTAARTDNATRYHTRPCLEVDALGAVDAVDVVPGGVRVRGWAFDPGTSGPISVVLYDCNNPVATVVADRERPDIAAAFPGRGANHGFDVFLRPCPGTRLISVAAVDTSGQGSTWLGHRIVDIVPNASGHLDNVVAEPGAVRVVGWAVDPWSSGPMAVDVYVDGALVLTAPIDRDRPDVAAAFPFLSGPSGFDVAVPQPAGSRNVCVVARSARTTVELGCRPTVVPAVAAGAVDVAVSPGPGAVRVQGWVATAAAVDVAVDGEVVATVLPSGDRPAVVDGATFDSSIVAVGPGERTVTVTAVEPSGGRTELASSTVAVASTVVGQVTALEGVPGGVRVATTPVVRTDGSPAPVRVLVDGRFRASLGSGSGGIDEVLALAAGVHEVSVVSSIDGRGTIPLQLAAARIVVP
jgi:hypothetical protein